MESPEAEEEVVPFVCADEGFYVPEAKSKVHWWDTDTLLLATDWGEGSLTLSGYPQTVRLWRRGTVLESATLVYDGLATDVEIYPFVWHHVEGVCVREHACQGEERGAGGGRGRARGRRIGTGRRKGRGEGEGEGEGEGGLGLAFRGRS